MMGACGGKSNTRAVFVQARKPLPISASLACVNSRMIEVLPLCTLPSNQTTGAKPRARSAMGCCKSAEVLMTDYDDRAASVDNNFAGPVANPVSGSRADQWADPPARNAAAKQGRRSVTTPPVSVFRVLRQAVWWRDATGYRARRAVPNRQSAR